MDISNIQDLILKNFEKKVKEFNNSFLEIHQTFLNNYLDEIRIIKQKLKFDQQVTKSPKEIWPEIIHHYSDLRFKIQELVEKQQSLMDQPFWQEFKNESISLLSEIPLKLYTSFVLDRFKSDKSDKAIKHLQKKYTRFHYRFSYLIYLTIRKGKKFLDSGRKILPQNFLHFYLLIPLAQFIVNRWNQNLKMIGILIDSQSKITEQLKDQLLVAEALPKGELYWKKVINPELEKCISNYENSIKSTQASLLSFYGTISSEVVIAIDEINKKTEQNWSIAGTRLLPNRKYNQRKINSKWRSLSKKQLMHKNSWESNLKKLENEWYKNIDLAQLQLNAAGYWHETGQIIKNKFYSDIVPRFEEIDREIRETRKSFQYDLDSVEDKSEIKNSMLLLNRKLVKIIRNKHLPDLLALLDPDLFSQSFLGFIKRLFSEVESLPEEHIVLAHVNTDPIPIKIKSDTISLKDIVQQETFRSAELKLEEINTELRLGLDASSRSLSRMDQVIEYNLEGALNKIKEDQDKASWQEAIDITRQGLERVEQTIDDLMSSLKAEIEKSLSNFDLIARDLQKEIQNLGDNEKLLKLKIRLTRARTKAKIVEFRRQLWQYIRLFLPKLLRFMNTIFKSILERYSKVRRLARLDSEDIQSEISFTQYLTDVDNKINQMPYIYQRIFRTEPLADNKFFVGRTAVLENLAKDFEDLKKNYHPLTALVGEKGSGKTSTLNFARRNIFKGFSITEIDITSTISTSRELLEILRSNLNHQEIQSTGELIEKINRQKETRICIIENIHNLFLRTIEGFQALDDLLLLISKTRRNMFWIVSCGRYAWEYLETVTKISSFFKRIIHLEDLSTDELKEMILSRHQISGYGIQYLPNDRILNTRQYKKLTNPLRQQQFLADYFFRRLSESAEGNIRVAIYFWMSAIKNFEESDINVSLEIKSESQFIHQLPTDEILSLAAFIQHEYLDEGKHALIFNQEISDSSVHIEKLYKKGLLHRNEDVFMIHPYLYRPVVRALKMRNII